MSKPNSARKDNPLIIVYRPVDALKPDPANPRRHSKKQIRQIGDSIKTFGLNVPLLVDAELKVIAGHGRLLACRELGWSEVPTISLDHLTSAQARAFMIADNRLAEIASWDDRLLAEQLKDLSLIGLDFSLEVTGFEVGEIDLRIGALDDPPAKSADPGDAVPEGPSGLVVSKPGDLWSLGSHRVLCGNVADIADCRTLMGEQRAAMAFTDHPYNVPIDGYATGLDAIHHRLFAMAAGEMGRPGLAVFLATTLRHHAAFSAAGALLYVCIDWRHLGELLAAGREADARLENLCVWVKDNAGKGSLYRSQHELVLVFKTGRGRRNDVPLGCFSRNRSNVWHYPEANSFSRNTKKGNLRASHPAVKPVALVADAILDCTARGDIVLDGFLGSGTTVIAAERTGRRCYGLELDPGHVDTIVRRWQSVTGGVARLADSGRSFNDLASEAEVGDAA
jgi:DNA modification methylase